MDQDKWDKLYEGSDRLLKQAAIIAKAFQLTHVLDLIPEEAKLRDEGKCLAAQLVHCTRCGVKPTIPCTARRSHTVRIRRAEWKGFIPQMTVHVHAENREYKGEQEVS